jgi:hypothetical protein
MARNKTPKKKTVQMNEQTTDDKNTETCICPNCKEECDSDSDSIQCSFCTVWLHKIGCSGLTDEIEFKAMSKGNDRIKYSCESCMNLSNKNSCNEMTTVLKMCTQMYYDSKDLTCQKLQAEIKLHELQIQVDNLHKNIQDQTQALKNYEKLLKNKKEKNLEMENTSGNDSFLEQMEDQQQESRLYVKQKENSSEEPLAVTFASKVKPIELRAKIKNVQKTKNGDLLLTCPDKTSVEILKYSIKEKYGSAVDVQEEQVKHKVQIFIPNSTCVEDIPETLEQLTEQLRHQNDIDEYIKESEFRVLAVRPKRNGTLVIILVDSIAQKFIDTNKKGKLAWSFGMYQVKRHVHIVQCYKCQKFGHKSTRCTQDQSFCCYCGYNHSSRDCTTKHNPFCINCYDTNQQYETNINCQHYANDKRCPTYCNMYERALNRKP